MAISIKCRQLSLNPCHRLIFERYDYQQLNLSVNADDEVNTGELDLQSRTYEPAKGVSFNMENAIQSSGYSKEEAKAYMFECLQAMDQHLTQNPEAASKGVDGLDAYLEEHGVTEFSIQNGFIDFYAPERKLILSLPVISGRQADLRETFYRRYEGERDALVSEILEEQVARERKETLTKDRAERRALAREAVKDRLGPPDDSMAVRVRLPGFKVASFRMPTEYWIRADETPHVLTPDKNDEYVCAVHVTEMLRRDVGGASNLNRLGYIEGHDAWMLKADLFGKRAAVDLASNLTRYVRIVASKTGPTLQDVDTRTTDYRQGVGGLWAALEQSAPSGKPVILPLYNRYSHYKGDTARYNLTLRDQEESMRSLNTHLTYSLGKGFRPLALPPRSQETVRHYLQRVFKIKPENEWVLGHGQARVGARSLGLDDRLESGDKVEYEDFWFSHHIHGSLITSLTELMGSGQFVPTGLLQVNTAILDPKTLPQTPHDPRLQPVRVIYLAKGKSVQEVFSKQVSADPEDWEYCRLYFTWVGLNPSRLRAYVDPIPIPDLAQLRAYAKEQGGLKGWSFKILEQQCDRFNKENPGEHVLFIGRGATPWSLLAPYFDDVAPPFSSRERSHLLDQIDQLNATVDLRMFDFPVPDGTLSQDYIRWDSGSYIWLNDEVIETLKQNFTYERHMAQIHVPSHLDVATPEGPERAEITPSERALIERVTADPEMRIFLTLILLNEQKAGWTRGVAARALETASAGLWQEGSVGKFQVVPRQEDWHYFVKEEGYPFGTFESYRDALRTDDTLNAKVAVRALEEGRNVYRHFLSLNEEKGEVEDAHFVSGILSMYNRPRSNVLAGLFSINAQKVSDAFALGLSYSDYETDLTEDHAPIDQIQGNDQQGIAKFWEKVGLALLERGWIHFTPEELAADQRLVEDEAQKRGIELQGETALNAVHLIWLNKIKFLESHLYRKIKTAYDQKMSAQSRSLSLLVEENDYETSAVENYGYRAVRYGQLNEILAYSQTENKASAEEKNLNQTPLYTLSSIQQRLNPTQIAALYAQHRDEFQKGATILSIRPDDSTSSSKAPEIVRLKGYEKFGMPMYRPSMDYPYPSRVPEAVLMSAPPNLPLRSGTSLNPGAKASGYVPIPIQTQGVDRAYWRAEYHLRDLDIGLDDFGAIPRHKNDEYNAERLADSWEKAKIHIATFPLDQFQLAYSPGKTLLTQDREGQRPGFLTNKDTVVNPAVGSSIPSSIVSLSDTPSAEVVGIFNGTYHQEDTRYRISGTLQYAGLRVQGKDILPPSPHMATAAVYRDGTVRLGTYENLPNPQDIVTLRQNEFMILENGQEGPGANPVQYYRFQDNIVRSYLAITPDRKHVAYVWSTHVPPYAFAQAMKKAGFSDVMLLDIHSVISASLAQPGYREGANVRQNHYDFVPQVEIAGQSFQWNPTEALNPKGSQHDFFSILAREQPSKIAQKLERGESRRGA